MQTVLDKDLLGLTGEYQEALLCTSGQAQIGVNCKLNNVNSISTCKLEMEKNMFFGNKS